MFYKIISNDLKLIFRDKSLLFMFIIPFAVLLLCRIGVPQIVAFFPPIKNYYWLIVASLTSITASTPSFLIGFLLLDEKDENVDTLIHILPVPSDFILKSRIYLTVFLGYISSTLILTFNNLIFLSVAETLFVSFLFALIPPILTFAITALAKNKIQAATIYKGLNIIIFLPVVAFFVPGNLKFFFGIIPFFWTFNAIRVADTFTIFMLSFFLSVITHSVFIHFLFKLYKKKNG